MKGHGTKFGKKQEAAIAALLTQRTIEEAAKSIGVGTSTLLRWQKLPEFANAFRAAKRAAFAQTVARLQYASSAAASVLLRVLADPATPASTKVRAAESVLSHTIKAMEVDDIEARVSELERAAEENKSGGKK
jgi:transposase-like protein